MDELADRYLMLLEGAVSHTLYRPIDSARVASRSRWRRRVLSLLRRRGLVPLLVRDDVEELRQQGRDVPVFAHTMVGLARIRHLRWCIEAVLEDSVPGDLIETGAWRGGAAIFMRGTLAAHAVLDRRVWVCDSFDGLPPPDLERYPQDASSRWHEVPELAVSLEEVLANFERYGLLDAQVRFAPGFFAETLPMIEHDQWAVIRLDGDMYGSTMDALQALYPGLSPGGFCIVDDYDISACREAVTDYRRTNGIREPIERIDGSGVAWRRTM